MKRLIAILLGLLTQIGLRAADLPSAVFANLKEDWGDADLKAASVEKKEDGSIIIVTTADYEKETMGFRVVLSPKWETWRPKELSVDLYRGSVWLESIGKPSEIFIQCLARAYKQKIGQINFSSVKLAAISLGGDPRLVRSEPLKLKLFFESEKEEVYAEIFLNLDLPHSIIQFHEKNPDYRKAVLGFLARGKEANQELQSVATASDERVVVTIPAGGQNGVSRNSPKPPLLTDLASKYPQAVKQVSAQLKKEGEEPAEFHATVEEKAGGKFLVFSLVHKDTYVRREKQNLRGNPSGKDRSMEYDLQTNTASQSALYQ